MKHRYSASIAASLLLAVPFAFGGTRPHYGGTLRVQSRDVVTSIDGVWTSPNTVLRQQLCSLLFDRLSVVDDLGKAHPSLATWSGDPQQRIWEFELRPGIFFASGSRLTSADVAAAISKAAPLWKVSTQRESAVVIDTGTRTPNLPELLALPEFSITKTDTDGSILGTGPFRIETFQPARRIVLTVNDDYWGGRPYLDKIDITMGGSVREELINRRLDLDDIVELSLDQARTVGYGAQANPSGFQAPRLSASQPSDLYALVFFRAAAGASGPGSTPKAPTDDPRLREAIALTIDRTAISRVLLQKQAEAAPSLLPQWMTGYSFLFASQPDLERARRLRDEAFRNAPVSIPLAYDASDNVARAIAERIAVNAREANITFQTFGEKSLTLDSAMNTGAQAVLVRMPLASSSAVAALADLEIRTGTTSGVIALVESASAPESIYAAERASLDGFRVLPVADVPQIYWLSQRVRDWAPPSFGGWRLENTWVDGERAASSPAATLR